MAIFRRESPPEPPPLTGASNAGGVGRNRDSEPISGFTAYAVKRSSGRCSKLRCDEPCRVYNGGAENDGHEIAGHENGGPNSRT